MVVMVMVVVVVVAVVVTVICVCTSPEQARARLSDGNTPAWLQRGPWWWKSAHTKLPHSRATTGGDTAFPMQRYLPAGRFVFPCNI
jgi:hypothetical protein